MVRSGGPGCTPEPVSGHTAGGHRLDVDSNHECESAGGSRRCKSLFTCDCDELQSHSGFGFFGTAWLRNCPSGVPDEKGRTDWGGA